MLNDIKKATEDFEEKLKQGYFSSMRDEAHKLAKLSEPIEDYAISKEDRDTKAVEEFTKSDTFKEIVKSLNT